MHAHFDCLGFQGELFFLAGYFYLLTGCVLLFIQRQYNFTHKALNDEEVGQIKMIQKCLISTMSIEDKLNNVNLILGIEITF